LSHAAVLDFSCFPVNRSRSYCVNPFNGGVLINKPRLTEIAMGRLSTESFDEFLSSLKRLGIVISNELELRERLAEARGWRYAFTTLANNGRSLGIRFENQNNGSNDAAIRNTLARFEFPEQSQSSLTAALRPQH
jgi:hypothetical protein